ncbi:MAG TPA: 50S ribosomal protein L16 [Firmicutes bacterium]|nr:50S ribosomal protein L16 [Bacillota bacterium]
MLQPKKTKWRRNHRFSYEGVATSCNKVSFGEFGLESLQGNYVTDRQIEAARVVLSRYTKKGGKSWIRIFPQLGRTKKPAQVRMGSGKGSVDHWAASVKKGTIMFEIGGLPEADCKTALKQVGYKLNVTSKVVKKGEEVVLK